MIKETMDKKFGAPWHVVAGGYFSYDITFEVYLCCSECSSKAHDIMSKLASELQCKNLLYTYLGGTTGVLLWKM